MKTLIFYGSPTKLTKQHKLVSVTPRYYVRAVVSRSDFCKALANARPKRGESILNTVEVEA